MIYILKYGNCGNIYAIKNVYSKIGIPYKVASDPSKIINPQKIILPGVGAFDIAMKSLKKSKLDIFLKKIKEEGNTDILGICVGYQLMARGSDEGKENGLGFFSDKVKRLNVKKYPMPHMGWNNITNDNNDSLFNNIDIQKGFYFLHNYHFLHDSKYAISHTNYDIKLTCASRKGRICGVQFHPEKSHANGIQLLKNFAEY
jgi:glutamine amidotransferase